MIKSSLILPVVLFAVIFSACDHYHELDSNDWPQYKHDNFRSGKSPGSVFDRSFGQKWIYSADQVPAPAWYGPAKEDAYANSGPLPSMRDYDLAYSPIIVGDKLYYGSSSDDALHCLEAGTGKEEWVFITDGPVRIAPAYYRGNVYFGSDDGYIYCINAITGKLKWKFSPSKSVQRLLNNGRLISFWPVRTGVLIEDGKAYFGASLIPWKKSYLCSIDANTGKVAGEGTYVRELQNVTFEGSMASSGDRLIQPQGRVSPVFINKATGEVQGQLPGSGGCFVLVTSDKHIVHPGTSRYISIVDTEAEGEKPEYMSFKGGKEMVVSGDTSYVLSDHAISAYDRKTKEVIWVNETYYAHRIIMAGHVLFAGATDTVYAISVADGQPLWKGKVDGTVYALATGNNELFASTGEGNIYCFSAGGLAVPARKTVENRAFPGVNFEKSENKLPLLELKAGPSVVVSEKYQVALEFQTKVPEACSVYWYSNGNIERAIYKDDEKTLTHRFVIPVRKDFIYKYKIAGGDKITKEYEYDNFFNFSVSKIKVPGDWFEDEIISKYVDNLISVAGLEKGLCLVLGIKDRQLPVELAQKTDMDVIVLDQSQKEVKKFREQLLGEGIYGRRISAYSIQDFNLIPIQSDLADLVVCSSEQSSLDEVIRLTAPHGKAVYLTGNDQNKLSDTYRDDAALSNNDWKVDEKTIGLGAGYAVVLWKKEPETNGVWTHEYGSPDNSAFGGESMWGSTSRDDFEIQWMGRPGPRFQSDRSGRKPSPLAVNGKIFVQGRERIAAINAYNGTILWSKDILGMARMNVHRDCSNWAADNKFIYAALRGKLLVIKQGDGSLHAEIPVPISPNRYDWGYVGPVNDLVIGTESPKNSSYTDYHGGYGWYDARTGPGTDKVMSANIFAFQAGGNNLKWKYENKYAKIINSTITIYDNKIFFIESGSAGRLSDKGRGGEDIFNKLYLVSINVNDGSLLWKKQIDNEPGIAAYYMAAGNGSLIIVSSNGGKYYLYNYNASDGEQVWNKSVRWSSDNHGGHLSKPAIVGNRLMLKPYLFRMDTGERLDFDAPIPRGGCASYALSEQSMFYRDGSVTQFNFDTRKFSKWDRLRPDCWISTVPALGMVLSPEAGGGCSCGNWFETSMVMAPKSRVPVMFRFDGGSKFIDTLDIQLVLKKGVRGELHFTTDGSTPDKNSTRYDRPIRIDRNTEIRVVMYFEKLGKERKAMKSKFFERLRPAPEIISGKSLKGGKRKIILQKSGNTGVVHYVLNGRHLDEHAPVYEEAIEIDKKSTLSSITVWHETWGKTYRSDMTSIDVDVPAVLPAVEKEVQPGLTVYYYKGFWMKVPVFDTLKALGEEIVSHVGLAPSKQQNEFGLRFIGFILIPEDGIYTFSVTSDDGSILYIQDKTVVDNDGSHDPREKSGTIALQAGLHPFKLDYFQNKAKRALIVNWEGPGFDKEKLPEDVLFH